MISRCWFPPTSWSACPSLTTSWRSSRPSRWDGRLPPCLALPGLKLTHTPCPAPPPLPLCLLPPVPSPLLLPCLLPHARPAALAPAATTRSASPGAQVASLREYARLVAALKEIVDTVDVKEPWKTPNAADLDATTFQSWCAAGTAVHARLATLHVLNPSIRGRLSAIRTLLHAPRAQAGQEHGRQVCQGEWLGGWPRGTGTGWEAWKLAGPGWEGQPAQAPAPCAAAPPGPASTRLPPRVHPPDVYVPPGPDDCDQATGRRRSGRHPPWLAVSAAPGAPGRCCAALRSGRR